MKKYYFIAVLLCSALLYSQDRYFINSDTRLYTSANTSSEFLGYFKYSAQVRLLSDNQNGWYKVQADNFNEGYVPAEFISKSLNARDVKTVDNENPIIYGGDHYHGSNHLFVLVDRIKERALTEKNSKIREVLFTGDAVTIG